MLKPSRMTLSYYFRCCSWLKLIPYSLDSHYVLGRRATYLHTLYWTWKNSLYTNTKISKGRRCKLQGWKALLDTDVKDEGKPIAPWIRECGVDVKALLKNCSKDSWKQYQKEMQEAFIKIATYFQLRLPLNNSFLKEIICLHPLQRTKISANQISRIAKLVPYVIPSSKISSIVDEWSVLRIDDDKWKIGTSIKMALSNAWIITRLRCSHWKLCLVSQDTPFSQLHWKHVAVHKMEMRL